MSERPKLDLAIIPARGGSVGLPGKNIRPLGGQPLIAWTVRAAVASGRFGRIIVSTDSEEIASTAADAGAEIPFLRPARLATSEARSADVVRHALEEVGPVEKFALLQPTSPFRSAHHIRSALAVLERSGASSLVSVCRGKPVQWSYHLSSETRLRPVGATGRVDRRQDAQPVFSPNGAIYMCDRRAFLEADGFFLADTVGFEMDRIDSLDIDDPIDFQLASAIVDQGLREIDR